MQQNLKKIRVILSVDVIYLRIYLKLIIVIIVIIIIIIIIIIINYANYKRQYILKLQW